MGRGGKRNLNPKKSLSKQKHVGRRKQRERAKLEKLRIMKQLQRENGKVNPVVNNPAEKNMSSADVAPHTETESANFETPPEISSISGGNEYNAAEIFPDYDVIDQSELADFEEDTQIPVSILGSLNETTVAKSGTLQEVKPDSTSPDQEENEGKENLTFFTVFATATLILLVFLLHVNYNEFLETIIF